MLRRKSISAECFNPEEDDTDELVIHPKTDEARARLTEAVDDIVLFKSLDGEQLKKVIDAMQERKVQAGDSIVTQGEGDDHFYVIQDGVYDVRMKERDDDEEIVRQYDGKGSFGELSLMYNVPRSATVVCIKSGTLWAMDRKS